MTARTFFLYIGFSVSLFSAETFGPYQYVVDDGEVRLIGFSCGEADIVIPSEIGGLPVTMINDQTFKDCLTLSSVVLPDTIVSIGDYAFYGCDNLTSINFPDSLRRLGRNAFYSCQKLTSIELNSSIGLISQGAFKYCYGITSLTIPSNVTAIGSGAFTGCVNLVELKLENGLQYIDSTAFSSCTSLVEVIFPDSVTTISGGAYDGCTSLEVVKFGSELIYIGAAAFTDCSNLRELFFRGPPPLIIVNAETVFWNTHPELSVYYLEGTPGWGSNFLGIPAQEYDPYLLAWSEYGFNDLPWGLYVDTGDWLGWLEVSLSPWVLQNDTGLWMFVPESSISDARGWINISEMQPEYSAMELMMVPNTDYGWSFSLGKWFYIPDVVSGIPSGWMYML